MQKKLAYIFSVDKIEQFVCKSQSDQKREEMCRFFNDLRKSGAKSKFAEKVRKIPF